MSNEMKNKRGIDKQEIILKTLSELNIKYEPTLGGYVDNTYIVNEVVELKQLVTSIRSHLERQSVFIPKRDIEDILSFCRYIFQREDTIKVINNLRYEPGHEGIVEKWCRMLSEDRFHPVDVLAWTQVIYNIKRSLRGLYRVLPFFLNGYGFDGLGKTQAIRRFSSVLPKHKCANHNHVEKLVNNEKNTKQLLDHVLIALDELSGMDKAEITKFKNMLDARDASFVALYTNDTTTAPITAQLVGSSNTELSGILIANANVRKWYEYDFYTPDVVNQRKKSKEKYIEINNFDVVSLFRSVNEDEPSPLENEVNYQRFCDRIKEKCISPTKETEFLREYILSNGGEWVRQSKLYEHYVNSLNDEDRRYKIKAGQFKSLLDSWGFQFQRRSEGFGFYIPRVFECPYMKSEVKTEETLEGFLNE